MNYDDRINNMLASGTLTAEQADTLRQSTAQDSNYSQTVISDHTRKKLSLGWFLIINMTLLLLFVIIVIPSSPSDVSTIQDVTTTLNQTGATGNMNKSVQSSLFFTAVILIPLFFIIMTFILTYNSLVNQEEEVLANWAQVESNLQRRGDLIPNLVKTVKTYMEHETELMDKVSENRAGGLSELVSALEELQHANLLEVNIDKLGDETFMQALATEQAKTGQQLNKLMGVVEDYPDLRSSDNFMSLQAQLEGTENRINISRIVFNESVRDYNSSIRKIPGSLIASIANFRRKAYFQADDNAKQIEVNFK